MDGLKSYLLAHIEPSQFSLLVREALLQLGFFETNPIDGRGDQGVDIELFTLSFNNWMWVVQVSVQKTYERKIRETIRKLTLRAQQPQGLIYITNRSISTDARQKIQDYAYTQGLLLQIFEEQWMLDRLEVSQDRSRLVVRQDLSELLPSDTVGLQSSLPGYLRELFDRAHESLCKMRPQELPAAYQALASCMLSFQFREQGFNQKALFQSQKGCRLAESVDNETLQFLAHHLFGEVLKKVGRQFEAADFFQKCLTFSHDQGEKTWEAYALRNLAETHCDVQVAQSLSSLAARVFAKLGPSSELGVSLGQQSKLSLRSDDILSALRQAEESLEIMRDNSPQLDRGIGNAHLHSASAHLSAGDYESAIRRSLEAERMFRIVEDRRRVLRAKLVAIEASLLVHKNMDQVKDDLYSILESCVALADAEGMRTLLRIVHTFK